MIISADEKPSIQARGRIAETLPPRAGVARGQRVEHTYGGCPGSRGMSVAVRWCDYAAATIAASSV